MKDSTKKRYRLAIVFKYIGILVATIVSYIGFMANEYGADIEEKARNGNSHDKYLAAIHYMNRDYSLDYHCPKSSVPMATVLCYKAIMLTSSQTQPIDTTNRALYWIKESIKQKESAEALYLLSQYYLKSRIFEKIDNKKPTQEEYKHALKLLNKAYTYSKSSPEINYLIGWIYLYGLDGNKKIDLAKKYLTAAKELGHPSAGSVLEQISSKENITN